jgi:hypothetical protein
MHLDIHTRINEERVADGLSLPPRALVKCRYAL